MQFQPLLPIRFPLIPRFYKSHYPSSKPKKHDCIWVAENQNGLQGVVRFQLNDNHQFLTGMAIATSMRSQGLGHQLLNAVEAQCQTQPCYCFAYDHLVSFYQAHGFEVCSELELPEELQIKWQQIQNSKKVLTPMRYRDQTTKAG